MCCIEFASMMEALWAAHQGVPQGFRYGLRLLDVDFVPWGCFISALRTMWYPSLARIQWAICAVAMYV